MIIPDQALAFDVCSDPEDYNGNAPCTHEEMTAYGFEVYKEKNSDTKINIEKVEDGAGHEDEIDHIYAWHNGALPGSVTFTHFWDADATFFWDPTKLNRYAQVDLNAPGLDVLSSLCLIFSGNPPLAAACYLYVEYVSDPRPFPNGWQKVEAYWSLALGAYANDKLEGNRGAYHYLGHIAHHIGDNTIPTHVHLSGHDPISGDDSFEDWMSRGGKDDEKKEDPGSDIDDDMLEKLTNDGPLVIPDTAETATPIEKLFWLLYTTNQIADFFPSDRAEGDTTDLLGWAKPELDQLEGLVDKPTSSADLTDNDCTGILCIAGGEEDFDNNEDGDLGEIKKYSYLRGVRAMASLFELFDETTRRTAILNVSIDRIDLIDISGQFDDCDDDFTSQDCDFYSRVTIDGYSGQNEADAKDDDDDYSPSDWNWGHAFDPFRTELIDIEIEILDEDNTIFYPVGPDGRVNVSNQEGYGVTFKVDPQKCMNGEPGGIIASSNALVQSPLESLKCDEQQVTFIPDDDDEDDDGQAAVYFTITMLSPDLTPPVIQCASADGIWHNDDVTIACTASDDESGLADPADASFNLVTSVPPGTETDNAATGSRVVCDANDNCAMAGPVYGNKVDKKAPEIAIVQPITSTYTHSEILVLDYSVTDGGSGVATVTATMDGSTTVEGNGLQSGQAINLLTALSLGPHTFAVDALDQVDNASPTASVTFTIIVTPQSIIDAVDQFTESGASDQKTQRSLLAKLSNAMRKWDQGQCRPAVNIYGAFINEVQAQSGKAITQTAADILVADAEYLVANCPGG